MTTPETEAEIKRLAERAIAYAENGRAYLALATPQGDDVERAHEDRELVARWMMRNGYATGHGDTTADLLEYLHEQHAERLAQVRAQGAEWPGTVPACPACMSTSDVEWASCTTPADACPLKALPRSPEHTT